MNMDMHTHDLQYATGLEKLMIDGDHRMERTGVGASSLFDGFNMSFDLSEGFPLLTTKKVHFKSVVTELLWMLRGDTNIEWLHEHSCSIWDEWADATGDLGPIYGKQWRSWDIDREYGIVADQITNVIESIKTNPYSRRHVVSAWNVSDLKAMALTPCHCLFQFFVSSDGKLSCHLYQRSADWILGVPFNIASYALLTHIIALKCGLQVGTFIHSFGDYHIYDNHREQGKEQLSRTSKGEMPNLVMHIDADTPWDMMYPGQFQVDGYNPHPTIKAPIAV